MSPIILIGSSVILLGLGMGLGYLLASSRLRRDVTAASDIQNELDEYRRHVTEHFSDTAQHFQTLGQQYQSLYKHMAQGADALCDPAQSDALLGFAAGNAPPIAASSAEDSGEPPEVIRDYVPEQETESTQSEPNIEAANTSEPAEDSSAVDDVTPELPEEEVTSEPVAQPTPTDTERTVH